MKDEMLKEAIHLHKQGGYSFLATASAKGVPHIACAGNIERVSDDSIAITECFCPHTVRNLSENNSLSLVLWDQGKDTGFQLLGTSQRLEDASLFDNPADKESRPPVPQGAWKLLMNVNKVLAFTHAPHTDDECEA